MSKSEDAVSRDAHANDPKLAKALTDRLKHGRELVAEDIRDLLVCWGMANGLTREDALQELQKPIGSADIVDLFKSANAIPDERLRNRQIARLTETTVRRILTRKQALQIAIRNTGMAVGRALGDVAEGHLEHTVLEASARTMYNIQKNVGTGFSFAQPNRPMVYSLVKKSRERIQQFGIATADRVYREVIGGVLAGHSVDRIAKEITDIEDDIWQAKRIVRTEVTAAASEGQSYALRSAGIDRYQYTATLDERTCPVCGALDQKCFNLDEKRAGENAPPMHPNCRCVIAAELDKDILKTLKGRTYRDPETGKTVTAGVPADMTYEEWRRQFIDKTEPVRTEMKETEPETSAVKVDSTALDNYAKLTSENRDKIKKKFDEAPERAVMIYNKYGAKSRMQFGTGGYNAGVIGFKQGMLERKEKVIANGKEQVVHQEYNVVFHECGHAINHKSGEAEIDPLSSTFRSTKFIHDKDIRKNSKSRHPYVKGDGYTMDEMLREEYAAAVETRRKLLTEEWENTPESERIFDHPPDKMDASRSIIKDMEDDLDTYYGVEDTFAGLTNSAGLFTHSGTYWNEKRQYSIFGDELFAQMYSAYARQSRELEGFKRMSPKTYEIFEELLESETQGM